MAIIPAMLVYCDGDEAECPFEGMQAFPDHDTRTIGEAWEIAKAKGWKRRKGGKHYCPDCAARMKTPNAKLTGSQRDDHE